MCSSADSSSLLARARTRFAARRESCRLRGVSGALDERVPRLLPTSTTFTFASAWTVGASITPELGPLGTKSAHRVTSRHTPIVLDDIHCRKLASRLWIVEVAGVLADVEPDSVVASYTRPSVA